MRLTKNIIEHSRYTGKSYWGKDGRRKWSRQVLWDDAVKGLGVRLLPTDRKVFILSYRIGNRKRQLTLGDFGVLTLQQARNLARQRLVEVIGGTDPLVQREKERNGDTVRDLAERYLTEHAEPKKKPSSVRSDRQLWRTHVLPALGHRKVADITRADIAELHARVGKKTPGAANRTIALLSKAFNLAELWELRDDGTNPCRHIKRFKERKLERYLSGEEMARLGEVLAESTEPPEAIAAIRLLLLTGCRSGEILPLKWDYVDFGHGCLRLPDSKTGAKVVPLGAAALELLSRLPQVEDNPYVLPGRGGRGHLVGLRHIWARLREKAGIPDVRVHDLRHSFASVGASGGLGLPIIGKLLGHRSPLTTARYSHLADDPVKQAADRISEEIAMVLGT